MEQNQFVSLIAESPARYGWFLGAGTSQSAGLPTAWDIIWDLKRREYNSQENQKVPPADMQNQAVRDKIQAYLLSRNFPEAGDASEYTRYFELIFEDNLERQRRYIHAMLSDEKVALAIGQRVLAAMLSSNLAKVVFTTNFDTVVETAVAEVGGKALAPFHLEGAYAVDAAINSEQYPIYCKLHGDFRYQSIKNLEANLRTQNEDLGKGLLNACNRFGLIVAGYSGRDASVMELFARVLETNNPFPHGLFWTKLKGSTPLPAVTALIDAARERNVTAEIVDIETFDTMMSRVWRQIGSTDPKLDAAVRRARQQQVAIGMPPAGVGIPILRTNAIYVEQLPHQCLQLNFKTEKDWSDLKAAEARARDQIVCTKGEGIWGWGSRSAMAGAFGPDLASTDVIDMGATLADLDNHRHVKGFVEKAACRALARGKPFLVRSWRSGYGLIVDRNSSELAGLAGLSQIVGGLAGELAGKFSKATEDHPKVEQIAWAEAVQIDFESRDGKFWLLMRPDVWIWPRHARDEAIDFLDKRRGGRFNAKADEILSAWMSALLPPAANSDQVSISLLSTGDDAENPRFLLKSCTSITRRARA